METRKDGISGLYIGYTRSGKSTPIKDIAQKNSRVLVSDVKGEYGALGFEVIETKAELIERLKTATGDAKIAFKTRNKQDFQFFCACALNWVRQKPGLVICEELAMNTNAGKADGHWGVLVNQGLGFGLILLATAQRAQEIDKTILMNATYVHIAQQDGRDSKYLAAEFNIDESIISDQQLKFIVVRRGSGVLVQAGEIVYKSATDTKPRFRGIKKGGKKPTFLQYKADGTINEVRY